MTSRNHIRLPLALLSAAVLTGCATKTDTPPGKVVNAAEYEYVTPLGSNIPVRVRKGSTPGTASPISTMSGEEAEQMIHRAGGQAAVEKGGR